MRCACALCVCVRWRKHGVCVCVVVCVHRCGGTVDALAVVNPAMCSHLPTHACVCSPTPGAMNKPRFNASGDKYVAPKSMTNFFSRGGGSGFKAGKSRRVDRRAGAVHSVEEHSKSATYHGDARGGERRGETAAKAGFRPAGKTDGMFSRPGILGPNERSSVQVVRSARDYHGGVSLWLCGFVAVAGCVAVAAAVTVAVAVWMWMWLCALLPPSKRVFRLTHAPA